MEQRQTNPAAPLEPAQEVAKPKRGFWTPERQTLFLRTLAATHNVAKAARAAGMTRQSAYELRGRLKGEPFDLCWEAALLCGLDALADAAIERALNGVEVPHFHKGELIHTSRRYDEKLTIALLALRERKRSDYMASTHPAFAFMPDGTGSEFASLLRRIERGPDRWDDER